MSYFAITLLERAGISMPFPIHQSHYTLIITTLVMVIISRLTVASRESIEYFESMRGVSGDISHLGEVAKFEKSDKVFVTCIVSASLILMAILAYLFYFIPLPV